ncbi:hypothetical protein HF329_15010 [Chitinophaga oryzae]|uniref:Uncharacterized protein n=1 Tax=Chitinophaga oryzae TaxID=2725414 RepID=A0AAE6ZH39_9BACT|nr:hypothetical protein [Chitinophaga oryzae]QJB32561.1 hypothetical protein HF329_15010 [Chitinophaga oryzae]
MKIRFFLLFIILGNVFHPLKAQLKAPGLSVGSKSADSSAILDAVSTTQGVLVPRVFLTGPKDNVTIKRPANSLLVYNTNSSLVGPLGSGQGFFYNYGSKESPEWVKLGSAEPKKNTNGYTLTSFYTEECKTFDLLKAGERKELGRFDDIAISSPENCVVVNIQQSVLMDDMKTKGSCWFRFYATSASQWQNSESFEIGYSETGYQNSSISFASYTFVYKNLPVGNVALVVGARRDASSGSAEKKPLMFKTQRSFYNDKFEKTQMMPSGNITVSVYEKDKILP